MDGKRGLSLIDWIYIVLILLMALFLGWPINFLEASTSSHISRVKADLRMVGVALEYYYEDSKAYPTFLNGDRFELNDSALTTPIAYLTGNISDFHKTRTCIDLRIHPIRRIIRIMMDYGLSLIAIPPLLLFSIVLHRRSARHWSTKRRIVFLYSYPCALLFFIFWSECHQSNFRYHSTDPPSISIPPPEWRNRYQGFNYYTDGKSGWVLQGVGPNGRRDLVDLKQVPLDRENYEKAIQFLVPYTYDPSNGSYSAGDIFQTVPWSSGQTVTRNE